MQFHEVATIFPMMSDDDFSALRDDIKANGLRQPITTWRGKIVDGRNRYRACKELGIVPHTVEWDGRGSLTQYVVSLNLARRHLTSSQKAAVAVDMLPHVEAEAEAERRVKISQSRRGETTQKVGESQKHDTETAERVAQLVGTNRQYVSDAKRLHSEAPALFEKVKSGELSITQAKREHIKSRAPEPPPLPTGKYRVIYADPPWQYGNTQPDYHAVQDDHYALMTIDELCAMPVKDMAEDNAVLFMWVTSPILPESLAVISSWGFKYKASFVWDKVKHNMGHYNSVRHEFLFVCVRGSCQPDVQKLFDSVVSIERTEHSVKPEFFREIIDTIYPNGKRIELFARRPADGWECYGNELPA